MKAFLPLPEKKNSREINKEIKQIKLFKTEIILVHSNTH